jgi:glycosyltransferase involved in cell wall biosynthesis
MSKVKILFFTNNFNRTGAEVVLFNLICKLDPTQYQIGLIVTSESGQLINELPEHIDYFQLKVKYNIVDKVLHYFGIDLLSKQLSEIQKKGQYTIWYVNSLSPSFVLKYAKSFNVTTICHIHELSSNYAYLSDNDFRYVLKSDVIISCSQLVYEQIIKSYDGRLETINSAIDTEYIAGLNLKRKNKGKEITVVCSGSISDRKGTDLFIDVALRLKNNNNYKFVWLGQFSKSGYSIWIKQTLAKLRLSNIEFISPTTQYHYYTEINNADLYFSSSREESLGLAMMEALYLGLPVVALNSGGPSLFIDASNGLLINSFDENVISSSIEQFIEVEFQNFTREALLNTPLKFNLNNEFNRWEGLLKQIAL